ncbi:hypothetical protein DT073_02470 [Microbacterium sp. ABRD28]|nr:hypothetical protein DT073_02470 [Microbacterium sp. ABRD28]
MWGTTTKETIVSDRSTPDEGEYTDEETRSGRFTHQGDEVPGQYEDAERADGTRTADHRGAPGEYEDAEGRDGTRTHPEGTPGEYTDVDQDGHR